MQPHQTKDANKPQPYTRPKEKVKEYKKSDRKYKNKIQNILTEMKWNVYVYSLCLTSPRLRLFQNSTQTSECVFYRTAFSVKTIEILSVLVGINVYWSPSLLFFLWAMPVRYTLQNGLIWKPKGLRTRHKKPFSKKIIFPGWRTGQSFCPLSSTFCPLSSTSTLNHK